MGRFRRTLQRIRKIPQTLVDFEKLIEIVRLIIEDKSFHKVSFNNDFLLTKLREDLGEDTYGILLFLKCVLDDESCNELVLFSGSVNVLVNNESKTKSNVSNRFDLVSSDESITSFQKYSKFSEQIQFIKKVIQNRSRLSALTVLFSSGSHGAVGLFHLCDIMPFIFDGKSSQGIERHCLPQWDTKQKEDIELDAAQMFQTCNELIEIQSYVVLESEPISNIAAVADVAVTKGNIKIEPISNIAAVADVAVTKGNIKIEPISNIAAVADVADTNGNIKIYKKLPPARNNIQLGKFDSEPLVPCNELVPFAGNVNVHVLMNNENNQKSKTKSNVSNRFDLVSFKAESINLQKFLKISEPTNVLISKVYFTTAPSRAILKNNTPSTKHPGSLQVVKKSAEGEQIGKPQKSTFVHWTSNVRATPLSLLQSCKQLIQSPSAPNLFLSSPHDAVGLYDIIPFIFDGELEKSSQGIEHYFQQWDTKHKEDSELDAAQMVQTCSELIEIQSYGLLFAYFSSKSEHGREEDDEATFNNEFFLGLTFFKVRKYCEALQCFKKCESTLSSTSLDRSLLIVQQSTIEFHCAEALRIIGQSRLAIEYYQKSLNSQSQESEIDQFDSSRMLKLEKLATALKDDDQISKSVECLEEAVESSDEMDSMSSLTSLANTLHHMGDHSAAIKRYEQALEVAEKLDDVSSLSWLHGNLGNSYLSQGMKYKGLHFLNLAMEDAMTHDFNPSSLSRVFNNLGTGYQATGDTEQAEELYQQALSHATLGDDVIGQARALGNLGNIHLLKKEYASAVDNYNETLNLSSDKSVAEVAHHNRGCAYYELAEQMRKAQTLKEEIDTDFQFKGHGPHFHSTAHNMLPEDAMSLYLKSMCDFRKVIHQHESKFAEVSSSVKNLDLFVCLFDTNSKTFSRAQDSAYALGDHHSALLLAEQCRARTLAKHMLQQKSFAGLPLYAPLSLDQVVAIMRLQEPNVPVIVLSWTGNRLLGWILINDGKDVTMDTFEQEISKEAFDGNSLDNYLRVKLNQLLSDGLDLEDELSSNKPLERKKESSEVVSDEMSEVVNETSEVINETSKVMNETPDVVSDETSEAYKLFKLVGDPISEVISNAEKTKENKKKRIILIPDSTLKLVPYSALSISSKGCKMGDEYSITFMPSILTLGIMSQTPRVIVNINANKNDNDICIVGNPSTPPFSIDGTEWNLGPLPCSEEEAKWVGYYMRNKPLLRHEPVKSVVMDRLKTAKLIHLATHGSASRAFLVLAGDVTDNDKGMVQSPDELLLLYAADVQSLSLSAGLVVLTSCDSSRGVMKGDDIQGIARSFLLAGAQSVMTSIWKVPDKSACYFMQFFYRYLLDGFTSSEALSKASRSIKAFEEFSSMIHWSGYQITGKDVSMQCLTTNEDKLVEQMIGKRSPFPRLEVVTNLKDALINQSSANIQVLCGLSGVSLLEPIIDFTVDNHAHYPGGIAWISGCNENLLFAQFKILEKVVSQDDPSLVVIDALSPELMDLAIQRVQDYPKASIIVKLPCLPGNEHLDAQMNTTTRLLTTHDISVLTELQVTQRLVYHIETSHCLAAGRDEREALSYLSSLCYGSPFITQLLGCLIEKFSIKFDSPNEGINAMYRCLKQNDTDCDTTKGLDDIVDSVLKCFIEEKLISIPSLILLRCLSLFGSLPIPESVVVAISEKIAEGQPSSKCSPVMVSEIWRDLCSVSLLHTYPTLITHPSNRDIPLPVNLYYMPETITDSISRTVDGLDNVMCVAIIHSAMESLITDRLSSPSSPVLDCLYFPALLNIICLIAPNVDMYTLEGVSMILVDTYFR